ncbi:MAG: hypothetical protein ACHQ52_09640 [Candidatus Eisenbacteria bacterium]
MLATVIALTVCAVHLPFAVVAVAVPWAAQTPLAAVVALALLYGHCPAAAVVVPWAEHASFAETVEAVEAVTALAPCIGQTCPAAILALHSAADILVQVPLAAVDADEDG